MQSTPIESIEDLKEYLQVAIQLEHATIPPYLTALYSIIPGSNIDAFNVIRVVAVEEMLHLTLAANLLNAVGGEPDLVSKDFVPNYPTFLPTGQKDFEVGLGKFSEKTLNTFLNIERPTESLPPIAADSVDHFVSDGVCYMRASAMPERMVSGILPTFTLEQAGKTVHLCFRSIGEFYKAIANGIEHLCEKLGETNVFVGNPCKQVGPEHYYSGGGDINKVHDKESALEAINLISEQGEGFGGGIYDEADEISHFYRFQQLILGNYYCKGDEPGAPSGGPVGVDWEKVYPILENAKVSMYADIPEVEAAANDFNKTYAEFLARINVALNGKPALLMEAVGMMFKIKEGMYRLIRNPYGESGLNCAPTFEVNL